MTELPALKITDDLDKLLKILPPAIASALRSLGDLGDLLEVVMDFGRHPEARFPCRYDTLSRNFITREDIHYVTSRVGAFGKDNRAGIERTLHRISAIRNRSGEIIGLTLRVGRAVYGTVELVKDIIESGKSILLLGRPGVGKTTLLREAARVLADEMGKRVVVVDTSNEIAGDGDIPHPGIGGARRMQVSQPDFQHGVMIEAVENHMPEVIVVDEIGTEAEAYAARTIAERGVQLIATAHGNSIENLMLNPTLSDLLGGLQAVTLGDDEAKKRGTQKTVLERRAPPTFEVVIEIQDKNTLAIRDNIEEVVDLMLRGSSPKAEVRRRDATGNIEVLQESDREDLASRAEDGFAVRPEAKGELRIFPYGVSRNRLERAIVNLRVKARVARLWHDCDVVLTLKANEAREAGKLREISLNNIPVYYLRNNTVNQIQHFLREYFHIETFSLEKFALGEAEEGIRQVLKNSKPCELSPQDTFLRRLQHQLVEKSNLKSRSVGREPNRRVRIYND